MRSANLDPRRLKLIHQVLHDLSHRFDLRKRPIKVLDALGLEFAVFSERLEGEDLSEI